MAFKDGLDDGERERITTAFGQAVREVRKSKGLTQEGLALNSGLDRSYIGQIERGEKNLTLVNIYLLADTLGVKTSSLLRAAEVTREAND